MSRRIAVMIDLEWPVRHHHDVLFGVESHARSQGWACTLDPWVDQSLRDRTGPRFDGVIARATPRLASSARRVGVPVVNVWMNSPTRGLPTVQVDWRAAGALAAEHLLARGFRRFACLGVAGDRSADAMGDGFLEHLAAAGCACDRLKIGGNHSSDGKHWNRLMAQLGTWVAGWRPPTGVYVAADLLCRYLADVCLRRGLRIPHDAALVGTGNEPVIAGNLEPSLSSIDIGYRRVGVAAAELLGSLMDGQTAPTQPILIPPAELVARSSTDAFAVGDPLVAAALRFIADNSRKPIRVDDVVAALPTTRRSLERRFERTLGRGPAEEITRLRLEIVKRLLVESDRPLKALAREAGFRGPEQMWKVFRREVGMSPQAFRLQRGLG